MSLRSSHRTMLEPGTLVSAFSPGQAAASSEVKHARAGKEDAAPTATSIWASVALGRLQVCTRYGKEDAVPVAIEQKDQRRSGHLAYWVRREALGLKRGKRQQHCCCKRSAIQDRIFSALSTVPVDTKATEIQTSGGLANPLQKAPGSHQ